MFDLSSNFTHILSCLLTVKVSSLIITKLFYSHQVYKEQPGMKSRQELIMCEILKEGFISQTCPRYTYIKHITFTWNYEWHQEVVSIPNTCHMFYEGYLWDVLRQTFAADLTVIRLLSLEDVCVDDKHRTLSEGLPTEVSRVCLCNNGHENCSSCWMLFHRTDEFLTCMN
jgi:hypothetical protein